MIDPHEFVRAVTMGLGATWMITGLLRTWRLMQRSKQRMRLLSIEERWFHRQIALAVLRTTVLDPINLALLCLLFALWSLPLPH